MESKPACLFVVSLGKAFSGIYHFNVVGRWLATPERACTAHGSHSRDRRINMQQKTIRNANK